ncbi:MAG: tRNA (cytidine(34)-2'-O)-methyltransferase [Oligoflexales bacterium]|nr:tRNA (cytidine(34)-2'-O)-methyltransferase [Oligoflexales bacterium]
MRAGHLHVCLYQPEIPQNTGNIGRLVAATQCRLHLIKPFGFGLSDKNLRRPGLDYWPFLDLEIHDNFEKLLERVEGKVAFFSKSAQSQNYLEVAQDTELLVFGNETSGLPPTLHQKYAKFFYQIPMFHVGVRSLNLANAVSVVLYHQLVKKIGAEKFVQTSIKI